MNANRISADPRPKNPYGMPPLKRCQILSVCILALPAALWAARRPILTAAASFLVVSDAPEPADLIHVLGSGKDREEHGIRLWKAGMGRRLLFTGVGVGRASAKRARAQGVPEPAIVDLDSRARHTFEEASELKALLDAYSSLKSVLVVTNPYHRRRSWLIFRSILDSWRRLSFVPVPEKVSPGAWWREPSDRAWVISEYRKIAYHLGFILIS
jgi:uncharacterized SAM-binding protein YcdF (DUF218 family)